MCLYPSFVQEENLPLCTLLMYDLEEEIAYSLCYNPSNTFDCACTRWKIVCGWDCAILLPHARGRHCLLLFSLLILGIVVGTLACRSINTLSNWYKTIKQYNEWCVLTISYYSAQFWIIENVGKVWVFSADFVCFPSMQKWCMVVSRSSFLSGQCS